MTSAAPRLSRCPVCGGDQFVQHNVIWRELADDWQLSPEEHGYIDRQQGFFCTRCACNLRSMALARAICASFGFDGNFVQFVATPTAQGLAVLEINEAGQLGRFLRALRGHRLISYPEYDMTCLSLPAAAFDLVVHSDTLEHVPDPLAGLAECRRVLKPDGRCIYTVPIVVDRVSRSREGLKPSFHGAPTDGRNDMIVHHEFGADAWKTAAEAGFTRVCHHILDYPGGIALEARS
ncbi:MAG: methyltransferase domain-containing protein [Ignavibacteria bacterium]